MRNQKKEIVLIENDTVLGSSIEELLISKGYNVSWFQEESKILNYFRKNSPDIIISELNIPNMNAIELFLKLKKETRFSTLPFIIITTNTDENSKIKQLEIGLNDYLIKPFNIKELIYKTHNLITLKSNIEKKLSPDPFSKVTIKLSEKDFILSLNDVLIKKLKSKPTNAEIAKQLYISVSTLDKKVRKHSNKNISQYVREFKLDYAIKLIHLGEKNIQFLVTETGFNSFSYFSSSFKSYTGSSARDYIKLYNQNNIK